MTNVLFVDDDETILDLTSQLLETIDGVKVITANHGQLGLEKLTENDISLIVTDFDYKREDMNGYGFVQKVKEKYNSIPIIGVSGDMTKDSIEFKQIVDLFIPKPVNPDELIDAVKKYTSN